MSESFIFTIMLGSGWITSHVQWAEAYYESSDFEEINCRLHNYIQDLECGLDNSVCDVECLILERIRTAGAEFLEYLFKTDFSNIEIISVEIIDKHQVRYDIRRL
jgi:hypothetical protein